MFDNLRDSASDFYEEEPNHDSQQSTAQSAVQRRRKNARLLGMTAQQRFLLSFMFMVFVCVMGTLAMFVMEKMGLPF